MNRISKPDDDYDTIDVNEIDTKIQTNSLTTEEKRAAVKKISFISAELYKKESEFSPSAIAASKLFSPNSIRTICSCTSYTWLLMLNDFLYMSFASLKRSFCNNMSP